jgi:hypothetical protein
LTVLVFAHCECENLRQRPKPGSWKQPGSQKLKVCSDENSQPAKFTSSQQMQLAKKLGQAATSVVMQPESCKSNRKVGSNLKVAKVTWRLKIERVL